MTQSNNNRFLSSLAALCIVFFFASADSSTPIRKRLFGHRHKPLTSVVLPEVNVSQADSNVTAVIPEWKINLPSPLNEKTKTLQRLAVPGPGGKIVEVYLLGTAHVSRDSSRDVKLLLESINPNVIFLELCDQRIPLLIASKPDNTTVKEEEEKKPSLWKQLRQPESKSLYGMASTLLTHMHQDYATSLGVELGGEFRVAHDYWEIQRQNARLHMILGDRPLYLTLTRAWESLGVWGKTKLIIGLLVSSLQKPNAKELEEWMQSILNDDSGDLLTKSIAELGEHFPTLEEVIIRERDAYMACKLYQTCRQLMMHPEGNYTMVAIVGAGHVEGICRWLTEGNGQGPEQILTQLIQINKPIDADQSRVLVEDVMEVNNEVLQEIAREMNSKSNSP
jgi:pheromone shutdown protein TraB